MATTDLIKQHYAKLKKILKPKFYSDYSNENIFHCHIVAAFSKCFEFNILVNRKSSTSNSFFLTPALRGICEDLITLKFLKQHQVLDNNKLLSSYTYIQLAELVNSQTKFFAKNHPQQLVFSLPNWEKIIEKNTLSLKVELNKLGLNKEKRFPSVSHMATDAKLIELYDYLYAATSELVHFSPHALMRSGWSKKDEPFHHRFSTAHFNKYYSLFNKFYGAYLFILFCKSFKKELSLSKETMQIIKDLQSDLFLESRWPEIVTFEEMNVKEAEKIRLINLIRKIKSRISAEEMEKTSDAFSKKVNESNGGN